MPARVIRHRKAPTASQGRGTVIGFIRHCKVLMGSVPLSPALSPKGERERWWHAYER